MSSWRVGVVAATPGNVMNVYRAVRECAEKVGIGNVDFIVEPPDESYDLIVLPGVGHFENAVERLRTHKLDRFLVDHVRAGGALVGICLGMHLLFQESEEVRLGSGSPTVSGLALLDGRVVKMTSRTLPHIGWNTVHFKNADRNDPLRAFDGRYFYFVHSYKVVCDDSVVVAWSEYDGEVIPAVVMVDRVIGVQFHPEKSHIEGRRFLEEVVRWSLYRR